MKARIHKDEYDNAMIYLDEVKMADGSLVSNFAVGPMPYKYAVAVVEGWEKEGQVTIVFDGIFKNKGVK